MVEKNGNESCYMPMDGEMGSCKVESVISTDDRGQMGPLKVFRDMVKIRAGDKLAIISWEKYGKVCCISLIKVNDLAEMVNGMLGPLMKEILAK